jgi:TrmH family RNA methyltransferase
MAGAPHSSVRRYRELARGPSQNGLERELLLDGIHLLMEAHASGILIESAAFDHQLLDAPSARRFADQLSSSGTEVLIVSTKVIESMSPVRTPSGAIGIARCALVPLEKAVRGSSALAIIAHDVQDPGNVGAIIRTGEAAGATAFIASGGTADPLGWRALRGSMGSALRVPIARAGFDQTLRECRRAGLAITALVPRGGRPFFSGDFRRSTALLLGSEGAGLSETILRQTDQQVSIPMQTPVESLNVGVAAALVLYEVFRQRSA